MRKRKSSKAEQVRSRRGKQGRESAPLPSKKSSRFPRTSHKSRKTRKTSSSRTASRRTPSVVARRGAGGLKTTKSKKRPSPRRRYDVTLSAPGAEMRLPALPVIQDYWQIISGFLSAALTVLLIFLWNSPTFQVNQVEVRGQERFTAQEISMAIDVVGRPAFSLVPLDVRKDLENTYSGLKAAHIKVNWPADVIVIVEERQPALAWQWEESVSWIDANGVEFKSRGKGENLLRVQAVTPPPSLEDGLISPELIKAVTALAAYAPSDVPVIYDEKYGLGWQDPRGWQIYFGFGHADMAVKQRVYQAIVKRLEEQGIRPALISVAYVNAPYYRLER